MESILERLGFTFTPAAAWTPIPIRYYDYYKEFRLWGLETAVLAKSVGALSTLYDLEGREDEPRREGFDLTRPNEGVFGTG